MSPTDSDESPQSSTVLGLLDDYSTAASTWLALLIANQVLGNTPTDLLDIATYVDVVFLFTWVSAFLGLTLLYVFILLAFSALVVGSRRLLNR